MPDPTDPQSWAERQKWHDIDAAAGVTDMVLKAMRRSALFDAVGVTPAADLPALRTTDERIRDLEREVSSLREQLRDLRPTKSILMIGDEATEAYRQLLQRGRP